MKRVYIADVIIPDGIESKIRTKHNLTGQDVRESLIYQDVPGEERDDEPYGVRTLVYGQTYDGVSFRAWLYPVDADDGIYRLGSAYED